MSTDLNNDEQALFKGTCLCGEISFEVLSEPVITSTCHCSNCKKFTGTVFTTNLVFPSNSIKVTLGESQISLYIDKLQDSGNILKRHFCSNCGSPLYNFGGDFGKTCAVFWGALSEEYVSTSEGKGEWMKFDEGRWKPEVEYYSKDRVGWVHSVYGAEQPYTKPGRGE
ncbi:hypothetical protein SISSUDRAFT_1004593 [Sistotremastrum suecicum HHB10207 ss-3]|uniref:CENP-V/GFA domain-containing protein n=1 Tax=Sistotremastrum suecicum HHB10207 ss-3 TaxID=1314776 RepID=A0A166DHM0_9AGAM|nr:hypothetical protein SISSUDRAFT_1004593 [Sistotremastrum suecicum HHB10207 ss-3]